MTTDDYAKRVIKHFQIQSDVNLELLGIVQLLCPGTWVLEVRQNIQIVGNGHEKVYCVSVSNGDGNVTTSNKNLGAALAQLIYYLLNGSVYPLTGNMGAYIHPIDLGYVLKNEGDNNEK
jgi:hypothetical protein